MYIGVPVVEKHTSVRRETRRLCTQNTIPFFAGDFFSLCVGVAGCIAGQRAVTHDRDIRCQMISVGTRIRMHICARARVDSEAGEHPNGVPSESIRSARDGHDTGEAR